MAVRIAIPVPTSTDVDYNERSLPPYLVAIRAAGAEPVPIPLDVSQDQVAGMLDSTQGVLLPGSRFDVDPQRFGERPILECGPPDPARTAVDELLLQDAFNLRKPILGICHGMQGLNVWRNGSLIQDLDVQLQTQVNHRPGRDVVEAHPVEVSSGSRLEKLLPCQASPSVKVNSSHHQAVRIAGDNLRITAVSPVDGVVEAVELDSPDHFVVAVQWHPERTYADSAFSRAIFAALVHAAESWRPRSENS